MTMVSGPFDSQTVNEDFWSQMARRWLKTGVIANYLNQFATFADSTGMQVKVPSGAAWIEGHYCYDTAQTTLAISASNPTNPRDDRVILRLNWSTNAIALAVLTGTPAGSPTPPALTQNTTIWEIALATVRVDAAATTIAAAKVTSERTRVGNFDAFSQPAIETGNYQLLFYLGGAGLSQVRFEPQNGGGTNNLGLIFRERGGLFSANGGVTAFKFNDSSDNFVGLFEFTTVSGIGTVLALAVHDHDSAADSAGTGMQYLLAVSGDRGVSLGGYPVATHFGGGKRVVHFHNAETVPTSNPSTGGVMWCEAGALKYRGSAGTITTIAAA